MKKSPDPLLLTGMIFTFVGLIHLAVAIVLFFLLPAQPGPSVHGNARVFLLVFGLNGVLFPCLGIGLMSVPLARKRKKKRLREEGYSVSAVVTEIRENTLVTVNGRHPYHVICRSDDAYAEDAREFRSDAVFAYPNLSPGDYVRVFLDPDHPDVYLVDLEDPYNH